MKRLAAVVLVLVVAGGYYWIRSGSSNTPPAAVNETVPANGGADARRDVPASSAATASPVATRGANGEQLAMATFASGCFWCTESDFDKVPGVVSTTSGYTGGKVTTPTYQQVSAGGTGHVESVQVVFNPAVVSYERLLDVYWHNVDPFNASGQFCDYGEQYRPVIWVSDEAQRAAATRSKEHVTMVLGRTVVVTIEEAGVFYPAEDYHQDYYVKNPVRYKYYRWGCGRDARLADIWRSVAD
jgi:peptide-methionine (S)-S-oxide reductase